MEADGRSKFGSIHFPTEFPSLLASIFSLKWLSRKTDKSAVVKLSVLPSPFLSTSSFLLLNLCLQAQLRQRVKGADVRGEHWQFLRAPEPSACLKEERICVSEKNNKANLSTLASELWILPCSLLGGHPSLPFFLHPPPSSVSFLSWHIMDSANVNAGEDTSEVRAVTSFARRCCNCSAISVQRQSQSQVVANQTECERHFTLPCQPESS